MPARPTPEDAEIMGQALLGLCCKKPPAMEEIRNLIDGGANLSARDDMNRTPLILAIGSRNDIVAQLLLESGADPNAADGLGRPPLIWAVNAGARQLIPLLLDKGARIDTQDRDGYSALMDAAIAGQESTARLLIDRGAKLDLVSNYGHSALTLACLNAKKDGESGHAAIIRLLADAGANTSLKNREGKTCLDFLRERGHDELLAYIESVPTRREAARPKVSVPKPDKNLKLKPKPPQP